MAGNNDKDYHQNPEYTNEGLGREIDARKRSKGADPDRLSKRDGEYFIDPIKGESLYLDVEKRLAPTVQPVEEDSKKRTLHDPRKFEDLMQERLANTRCPEVQKLTNPEVNALRTSSMKTSSEVVRAKQKVNSFVQNLTASIGGLFSKEKKKTMCDNYGHVPPETWGGEFPNCSECGKLITSQEELRKASAHQRKADMKPYDNRIDL